MHNACAELLVSERRYDIKAFKGFWEIHVKTRKQYKAVASELGEYSSTKSRLLTFRNPLLRLKLASKISQDMLLSPFTKLFHYLSAE